MQDVMNAEVDVGSRKCERPQNPTLLREEGEALGRLWT